MPAPGDRVYYHKDGSDTLAVFFGQVPAAFVAVEWDDGKLNLAVLDANGVFQARTQVVYVPAGGTPPASGAYCKS